jgi:hypothetical protein
VYRRNSSNQSSSSAGQSVVQIDLDGGGLGVNDIKIIMTGVVSVNDFLF